MTKATSDYLNRTPRTEEQARQEMLADPRWRGIRDDWRADLQRMEEGTYTPPPVSSKLTGVTPECLRKRGGDDD